MRAFRHSLGHGTLAARTPIRDLTLLRHFPPTGQVGTHTSAGTRRIMRLSIQVVSVTLKDEPRIASTHES